MGLTKSSTGKNAKDVFLPGNGTTDKLIALVGNPNVGKSTVFNALTGMHQHTGNWPGKTVTGAVGRYTYGQETYTLVDLPGCYSLNADSPEEEVAHDFIAGKRADVIAVVCDATSLERSLRFVLEVMELAQNVVVCINLMDEAEKKGLNILIPKLECLLGVPVVATASKGKRGYKELQKRIAEQLETVPQHRLKQSETPDFRAEKIAHAVVKQGEKAPDRRDRKVDRILAGKWGFAVLGLLLLVVFWLTIAGSETPSRLLRTVLLKAEEPLYRMFSFCRLPESVCDALVSGVYRMAAEVTAVMLPPMAIFFPLFTLLEDAGYLPRVAFILDKCFQKCNTCGKQALTMCMGFGCNAAGVAGARIIASPKERLIAILTNSFMPCNGRFPTLIMLISLFLVTERGGIRKSGLCALILLVVILLGVGVTFFVSKILSETALRGTPSSFVLELPPYRMPNIGSVLVRSVFDRTLYVLGRAVSVAAPAGLIVWLTANVYIGESSVLSHFAAVLDPFGKALGMDGVILIAFILGFPANETVIPITLMAYLSQSALGEVGSTAALGHILTQNGWTVMTAVNVILFSVFHWPCSTTLLTIKKETGSLCWTAVAALLPTAVGVFLCFTVARVTALIM